MSGGPNTKAYSYLLSSDVGLEVLVRVNALERLATCTNAATQVRTVWSILPPCTCMCV
jgi:hypothetical protein